MFNEQNERAEENQEMTNANFEEICLKLNILRDLTAEMTVIVVDQLANTLLNGTRASTVKISQRLKSHTYTLT